MVTRTIEELNYCYFVSSRPQCCHTFALSPEVGFVSLMGSSGGAVWASTIIVSNSYLRDRIMEPGFD